MISDLSFNLEIADEYRAHSQIIRVLSENWTENNSYCPYCGCNLKKYPNNMPVADFFCEHCNEDFELKSKKDKIGKKISDGSYDKMISRLHDINNPNFFFLIYQNYNVKDLFFVPKHFFTYSIIEKRNPLSKQARRAGWVGCNILVSQIPNDGKIFYVKNGLIIDSNSVKKNVHKTIFLSELNQNTKGWTIDILKCIDHLHKKFFSLEDLYQYESILKCTHPENKHIRAKIRQQLQFLRNKNYLEFKGNGNYILL